jgi:hypothetical protein
MTMLLVHHGRLNGCNKVLKHDIATFGGIIVLLVSTHVALVILCNQGVEWLIISYSTLITFRVTSGAMFMLTKMPS